jgi:hypothetical protein
MFELSDIERSWIVTKQYAQNMVFSKVMILWKVETQSLLWTTHSGFGVLIEKLNMKL